MTKKIIFLLLLIATQINATTLTLFNPTRIRITDVKSGACFSQSIASNAPHAWRCSTNNMILDPCFVVRNQHGLICTQSPWSIVAIRLILTKALPTTSVVNSPRLPWAVALADGTKCVLMTGTTFVIERQRVNYACENNNYLYGDFQKRGNQDWTVKQFNSATQQKTVTTILQGWQ